MRKRFLAPVLAAFALTACQSDVTSPDVAVPGPSLSVSMNPDGTGFVGKGDVQVVFGWNNKALQTNAAGVTFSYNSSDSYSAVCEFTTGEGTRGERVHEVTHRKTRSVSSVLDGDPRQVKGQNQFTGFILNGYIGEPATTGGALPVLGGACPGNQGTDGTWTSVTFLSSEGGLYATFGGVSHLLPITPIM
jgi:hypothetical protein